MLRLWQGLGYYSRARNLHATAKHISSELGGVFPNSYLEILKLKGVGPYTAAAISSICFGEPRPVVDGNVFRFASRYFGIKNDIAKQSTRKLFEKALERHISHLQPGAFNQALMEYGSSVCSPSPYCDSCVFHVDCFAFAKGLQTSLPLKSKKIKVANRSLHYLAIHDGVHFLLKQRGSAGVWAHLFDFFVIEGLYETEKILAKISELISVKFLLEEISQPFKHILSHQKIEATFYKIKLAPTELKKISGSLDTSPYSVEEIVNLPKPKLIVNYFQEIGIKS